MSEGSNIYEIITGISQAAANGRGVANSKYGIPEIGLRKEQEDVKIQDRRVQDGFGVTVGGNKLKVSYQSEISIKEVYKNNFENYISEIIGDCVSFLKKEYKSITKKTLGLKMVGEPMIRVEHANKHRSWVTAYCLYEVEGLPKEPELGSTWEERLDSKFKKWYGIEK